MTDTELIQGAYLQGFEPSAEDLTAAHLYQEAERYLYYLALATA